MGITYVAVAAQYPIAQKAAAANPDVAALSRSAQDVSRRSGSCAGSKESMATGESVIRPITGEDIPVRPLILYCGLRSGAVMAVPRHDQRDWEFATNITY